ncbi:MAG: DUF362 domain-containing protein [Patescibacteria group bacterium]
MSKVAFIKSDDRSYNIDRALSLIKSEIINGLRDAKKVVIKPNCVTDNVQLAATHAQALNAVLSFIQPYVEHQVTLAEGTAVGETMRAFENFGYFKLQGIYGFAVTDLNTDEYETVELVDRRGKPWLAKVARTLIGADYLISVSPPKTHNVVAYTGAIKNVAVGSLARPSNSFAFRLANRLFRRRLNHKSAIHQGDAAINENIKRLYEKIPLKLAVLDAYAAMEGNGPINGTMVPAHYAIAGANPVAADWLACQLMGIDTADVGYLSLLGAGKKEHIIAGDDWREHIISFKMHENFAKKQKQG